MSRTFVVPLDGSPLAERALPYAIRLAQSTGARLILARTVVAPPPVSIDGSDWERLQIEAVREATQYLADLAASLSDQVTGIEIAAPYGGAVESIIDVVQAKAADGVVMATHGRTGFAHLLYGSVTEGVLARSNVPVFVVYARPGEAPAPVFSPESARLLVPQDGSFNDAPALQTALDLVGPRGDITLVNVATPPEHLEIDESRRRVLAYLDQQEESRTREAHDYLASVVSDLRERGIQVPLRIDVRLGDPTSGIAMAAIDAQVDLIVMATHGRTGIRRAVLGSVAGTVLRTVSTPVVLVHPKQPEAPRTKPTEVADVRVAAPMF